MKKDKKYVELYKRLRYEIQSGVQPAGSRLASKREQAARSGVSVITVEGAYRQLLEEGYIYSRERSGYYVADISGPAPARAAEALRFLPEEPRSVDPYFPYSLWTKTVRYVMNEYGDALTAKSPDKGCAALRNAIASYMQRCRGMFAQPEQIIIGSGSEQLYGYVVRMLGSDKVYGIEYPSYEKIEAVYKGAGARVERLPLAQDGISSGALRASQADVLHVTPFHSWPTGVTAPAARRYEYLRWAAGGSRETSASASAEPGPEPCRYIVEDDFDSEFFIPGNPPETLYSMDSEGRVIYLNTFSRSLAPSMRMGYMVLPESLIPLYDEKLGAYSCSVPLLEQYALAEFINSGSFERHLNRKRKKLSE